MSGSRDQKSACNAQNAADDRLPYPVGNRVENAAPEPLSREENAFRKHNTGLRRNTHSCVALYFILFDFYP